MKKLRALLSIALALAGGCATATSNRTEVVGADGIHYHLVKPEIERGGVSDIAEWERVGDSHTRYYQLLTPAGVAPTFHRL